MTESEFVEKQNEILNRVPSHFQGALSYLAYEQGHGGGYHDILVHLEDLVGALENPIKEYTEYVGR